MATEDSSRRPRTTGFPLVPLPEAVAVIQSAAKYGMSHSRSEFAGYMGHKTINSGAFKARLAAFKDWGLVSTGPDSVSLTELGRRIALPPDPEREADDLLEAFRQCEPFERIYGSFAKGQPLDVATIANTAVHRLGVAAASKDRFATSFVKSVVAIGLGEEAGEGKLKLLGEPRTDNGSAPSDESDPGPSSGDTGGTKHAASPSSSAVGIRLPWSLNGGKVLFEVSLDRALPPAAFGELTRVTQAIESLIRVLDTTYSPAAGEEDVPR